MKSFVSLLFITTTVVAAAPTLSYETFQSMLLTGVELQGDDLEEQWQELVQNELKIHQRRNLRGTATQWPFLVCDVHPGKSGQECLATIRNWLGGDRHDVLPVINKQDLTCVVASATYNRNNHKDLVLIPLTPAMKMAPVTGTTVEHVEATLCPGRTRIEAQVVAQRLRTQFSLSTEFSMEVGELRIAVLLPSNSSSSSADSWMHYLAEQPEVCFVEGRKSANLLNSEASTTVQGGSVDEPNPLHKLGLDGSGQVVAVSDTGLDLDNCYFYDAENPTLQDGTVNMKARKVVQYLSHADGKSATSDHGTHVAGSVAGSRAIDGKTGKYTEIYTGRGTGAAPGAKLSFFDIGKADSDDSLHIPPSHSLFGPGYSAGARIHSASWGYEGRNRYSSADSFFDVYSYHNPEFLFVVAAGNEGKGDVEHTVSSPGTTKNSIVVGATKKNGQVASFSSRGPTADGRIKPEIMAPGNRILSARSDPTLHGECDDSEGLVAKSGTSMAAPIISGAAAIVRQYFMEGWHLAGVKNPSIGFSPRASLVKAVLINGAGATMGVLESGRQTRPFDPHQGFGQANLLSSLPVTGTNRFGAKFINTESISHNEEKFYDVVVTEECGTALSVTLVWTDPPVAPHCNSGCVVNDLDLSLSRRQLPGIIYPNGLDHPDETNNVERVRIDEPIVGETYTVQVRGSQLVGDQDFSLVITGCIREKDSLPDEPTTFSKDSSCEDNQGLVMISDTEFHDCTWLAEHQQEFGQLCEYYDVATTCPSTCNSCPDDEAFVTANLGLNGGVRWSGMRFSVLAKKSMILEGLQLHMSSEVAYHIVVEIHEEGSSETERVSLYNSTVAGSGRGERTSVHGKDFHPIQLHQSRSYTVFVSTLRQPDLVMTARNDLDADGHAEVAVENDDVRVFVGQPTSHNSAATIDRVEFNGALVYSLLESKCADGAGNIGVGDDRHTCEWLSANMERFGYECVFHKVATFCPSTCGHCAN